MKKSLLAFVLAFSLVLSVAVPAFAAAPTDISGVNEQSAIEELVALGVIQGYEDGTFKPNNNITRAELAKIVVSATGGENSAALVQNVKSQFSDVKTGEWYTGYINVAAAKGYIQGYNGKFRPSDNIKFEEVVAIITRAIGYADKNLSGTWPYNVLIKADEIELFDNVTVAQGTLATRGIVSQIVNNSLDDQLQLWDAEAEQYYGKTVKDDDGDSVPALMISRLGTTTTKVLTEGALDNSKVDLNGAPATVATNFFVTGGKKLSELVGHYVTVLYNKDNKVISITDNQDSDDIIAGEIDSVTVSGSTYTEIEVDDKDYDFASSPYFFLNGDRVDGDDLLADQNVSLILNSDGEVKSAVASTSLDNALFDSYVEKTSSRDARIVSSAGYTYVNDDTVYTINGEKAAVADLKENDVLVIIANNDNEAVSVSATRKVVEGEVTTKRKSSGDFFVTIAGTKYEVIAADDYNDIDVDGEYKLFLNVDGKVAGFDTLKAVASDADLAIVLEFVPSGLFSTDNGIFQSAKLVYYSVQENKVVTEYFQAVSGSNLDADAPAYVDLTGNVGQFVEFTFNDDDEITAASNIYNIDTTVAAALHVEELTSTEITTQVGTSSVTETTYAYNSNAIVLNATDVFNNGDFDEDGTVTVGAIADISENDLAFVVTDEDGVYAEYIVLLKDKNATTEATVVAGQVTSVIDDTDSDFVIELNSNGVETEYAIEEDVYDELVTAGEVFDGELFVVVRDIDEDGTFEDLVKVYGSEITETPDGQGSVTDYSTSSKVFTLDANNAERYAVTSNTSIFVYDVSDDEVTEGAFADIIGATNVYVGVTDKVIGVREEAGVVVVVLP